MDTNKREDFPDSQEKWSKRVFHLMEQLHHIFTNLPVTGHCQPSSGLQSISIRSIPLAALNQPLSLFRATVTLEQDH